MENKSYSYKKISHFSDMISKLSNKPNKISVYTDKQFEEDLKKWQSETKTKPIQDYKIDKLIEIFKSIK